MKFEVRHSFLMAGYLCDVAVGTFDTREDAERDAENLRAEYAAVTDHPPRPSQFEVKEVEP